MKSNQLEKGRPVSPAKLAGYGAVAGLAGTIAISLLARLIYPSEERSKTPDELQVITPAGALAQSWGAAPEGAAELFALKTGSGLFSRDISRISKMAGQAVHYIYGTFWGIVYGVWRGLSVSKPGISGAAHGLFVWGFGPGWLVPAMKLTPRPRDTSPCERTLSILGHVTYGLIIATVFRSLQNRARYGGKRHS